MPAAPGCPSCSSPWWRWLCCIPTPLTPPARAAACPGTGRSRPCRTDITGPVAFTISLLAMVAAGAALVFGGEINEFVRRIIMLVLVASFIVGVTNLASALGISGAVV